VRDEEIIELNDQLNAKDAEITTVKNYFEKSELDQDELRQQMDALKEQNSKLLKSIEKL
jgi:transcription initiation factor IIF auxiliary subunit